jgi:PAS domain S-box-containing protein
MGILFSIIFAALATTGYFLFLNQTVFQMSAKFVSFLLVAKIFGYNFVFFLGLTILNYLISEKIFLKSRDLSGERKKTPAPTLEDIFNFEKSLDGVLKMSLEVIAEKKNLKRILFFWEEPATSSVLASQTGREATRRATEKQIKSYFIRTSLQSQKGEGYDRIKFAGDSPVAQFFMNYPDQIYLKNLGRLVVSAQQREIVEGFKARMGILDVNAAFPLFYQDSLKGFLLVKVSDQQFSELTSLVKEFFELLRQRVMEEESFQKGLSQYEKVFLLTGQLSRANQFLEKKQKLVEQLQTENGLLKIRLIETEGRLKETESLKEKLNNIEKQGLAGEADFVATKEKINLLEQEKKEFQNRIESLLEVNRELVASTANFSSVSKDLYEANKIIRENKNYLESLLERMSNGVMGINTEGMIVTYNRQMAQLTGISEEEVLEKVYTSFFKKIFPDADKTSALVKKAFLEGKSFAKHETNLLVQDKQEIPVNLVVVPLRGEEKEVLGVMVVATDLTDSKKLFSETRKRSRLESIQQMTVSLNHEINNPLTSVLCNIQFVLSKLKSGEFNKEPALLVESLFIAEKESKRIKKILEDLRKVNEPTTKEYLPGVEMIDITGSIKEAEEHKSS